MREKQVLALGFFDGIHIGHAALLHATRELAVQTRSRPAVMTFDVHPDTLVSGSRISLINSREDRVELIRRLFQIETIILLPFTEETMHMPWETFLQRLTAENNAAGYVVGHDFRFGWKGEGNGERLQDWCHERGLSCRIIPPVMLQGHTVSSTGIRQLLAEGDLAAANRHLGHAHLLTGQCVNGVLPVPPGVEPLPAGRYTAIMQSETTGAYQGVVARSDGQRFFLEDLPLTGHVRLEFTGCLC